MLLKELLGITPVKFKWDLNFEKAIFELDDQKFGIFIENYDIKLSNRSIDSSNVSYGRIYEKFNSPSDLDTSLINGNKPRTILSTVASALSENKKLLNSDVICVAAADQVKNKRFTIYHLAVQEMQKLNPSFKQFKILDAKTVNDSRLILLSKLDFTKEEIEFISEKLGIYK